MTSPQELEYIALREEVIKRIEIQGRIIQINLTFITAILAIIASGLSISWGLIMAYPPLGALIAGWWAKNEYNKHLLTLYIRNNLEPSFEGLGWEKWRASNDFDVIVSKRKLWSPLSKAVIFAFIQATVIGSIVLISNFETLNNIGKVLFVIDLASFIFIFIGVWLYYKAVERLSA